MSPPTFKLNNGMSMPGLGLGTWKSQPNAVREAVEQALKFGYRHIDCATVYGNEAEVGQALKNSEVKRDEIFITAKLWNTQHHPEDVEAACRKSLKALGLDYIDLYLIHWPVAFKRCETYFPKKADNIAMEYDFNIPIVDTWKAMEALVDLGLVKSIGLSNFNSKQVAEICSMAKIKPAVNQVECHPYLNQRQLLDFCRNLDVQLVAYSPFGSPDRPWAKPGEPKILEDPKLMTVAKSHGTSVAQVLIQWQLQRGVAVIPKSVTPSRIAENFRATDYELKPEEMAAVEACDLGGQKGRFVMPLTPDNKPRDAGHPDYPFNIEF